MIILGTSGSGKSTAAKLMLRTHIRNKCQIVAIDPENELTEITKTFGGDQVDIGKGGDFGLINPLEVVIDADEEEIKQGEKSIELLKGKISQINTALENPLLPKEEREKLTVELQTTNGILEKTKEAVEIGKKGLQAKKLELAKAEEIGRAHV